MFGINDWGIWLAYILCFASVVLCIVYGILNWNKEGMDEAEQIQEEKNWEAKETDIKSKF